MNVHTTSVRRLFWGLALMHGLIIAATPSIYGLPVPGAGVLALRADEYAGFSGSGIHFDAHPVNDGFDKIIAAVRTLKQRVVRGGTFGSGSDTPIGLELVLALETGVKFIAVLNKGASYTDTSIEDYYVSRMDPTKILILEGFNEVDNNNSSWGGDPGYFANVTTRFHATRLWRDAHANPAVNAIKLSTATVTSAFGASHTGHTLNLSADADYGAAHPYPGPIDPGAALAPALAAVNPVWGGSGSSLKVIVTETGVTSAPNATTPSYLVNQGVSTLAQAKYTSRLLPEYYDQGIYLCTPYEIINDATDLTNGEANFGWFNEDGTIKPVGTAIANTQALLAESIWTPPVFTVGTKYVQAVFTHANQSGWPNATGTDTNLTWVDGDGNENGHWSIVSNHGVCVATSQVRNLIGDSHAGSVRVYGEFRGLAPSVSNLCRLYARWSGLGVNYSADFNPGVSNQFSINKNGAGTTLASASLAAWSTMTAPNVELQVWTRGNDNILYARVWDSVAASRPTEPTLVAVDFGGATGALAAGSETVWIDNNGSGNQIYMTDFWAAPITVTDGSWSAPGALTLGKLDFTLSGTLTNVRSRLLQKADGSFWLLMWNRLSVYNETTKTDITNSPISVTLTLNSGGAKTCNVYQPRLSTSPAFALGSGTSFSISVPDELILVSLS